MNTHARPHGGNGSNQYKGGKVDNINVGKPDGGDRKSDKINVHNMNIDRTHGGDRKSDKIKYNNVKLDTPVGEMKSVVCQILTKATNTLLRYQKLATNQNTTHKKN